MFPARSAGVALLLLRAAAAGQLLYFAFHNDLAGNAAWIAFASLPLAISLCAGCGTPLVATLSCILELFLLRWLHGGYILLCSFHIVETASLVLLGPGAFSVDARLYGRRRINLHAPPK